MRGKSIVLLALALVLALVVISAGCAGAVGPEQTKWICQSRVGGSLDTNTRAIAPYFQKYYETTVVIENRTAGGGMEGRNYVYGKPADGSTLLTDSNVALIHDTLYKKAAAYPGDYLDAFIPVASFMASGGNAIFATKDSGIMTLADLEAASKQKTLKVATPFPGSTDHIAALLLEKRFGVKYIIVPYASAAEVVSSVLGKEVDYGIGGFEAVDPDTFNVICVTSNERQPRFPDTPTAGELGYPELEIRLVVGLFVKTGTPEEVIDKVEDAITKAWHDEGFQNWAKEMGILTSFMSRQEYTDYMQVWIGQVGDILPMVKKSFEEMGLGE